MGEQWEPKYANDSHPGLLSDVNSRSDQTFVTTMQADFRPPQVYPHPAETDFQGHEITARRKEMLKRFYWKQFSQEFFDELGKMPVEEDNFANFTTTYDDQFGICDFEPKNILDMVDPELIAKYPLYEDSPYSLYLEKIDRIKPSAKARHPITAFRKNSTFAKKWYDELE